MFSWNLSDVHFTEECFRRFTLHHVSRFLIVTLIYNSSTHSDMDFFMMPLIIYSLLQNGGKVFCSIGQSGSRSVLSQLA